MLLKEKVDTYIKIIQTTFSIMTKGKYVETRNVCLEETSYCQSIYIRSSDSNPMIKITIAEMK